MDRMQATCRARAGAGWRMALGALAALALAFGAPPARAQDEPPARVGRIADLGGEVFHAPEERASDWIENSEDALRSSQRSRRVHGSDLPPPSTDFKKARGTIRMSRAVSFVPLRQDKNALANGGQDDNNPGSSAGTLAARASQDMN